MYYFDELKDNPSTFPITIRNSDNESTVVLSNITDLNLCKGNYPDIDLDSPFILGVPEAVGDLEELMMVVKYKF